MRQQERDASIRGANVYQYRDVYIGAVHKPEDVWKLSWAIERIDVEEPDSQLSGPEWLESVVVHIRVQEVRDFLG